ncbi:MAG TPA: YidC family membrane integrase SpoIIIJ [Bacillota bacterium]|nr:YidC family membrane integrase SpoIIIJ [Bacillota bacterium]
MRKKLLLILVLIGFVALLTGCTEWDKPINAESTGFWNTWFVWPMAQFIEFFADLFNGSYGIGIIIVTLIVRLVLLPLNVKQIKSSKAMQDIQPLIKEINEKYTSKDATTQQKKQQETMALFQKHGVNPLAGCLPVIVQMPILIAIYHAIRRYDPISNGEFLWFALGDPDPIHVLPIIAAGATFLQQKLMMSGSPAGQNPQMMVMLYMMPIMIGVVAFFFPAALALYWVVGNIFMVAQTLFIRKPMMDNANSGGEKK